MAIKGHKVLDFGQDPQQNIFLWKDQLKERKDLALTILDTKVMEE